MITPSIKNALKTAGLAAGVALISATGFLAFMWFWFEKGGPF